MHDFLDWSAILRVLRVWILCFVIFIFVSLHSCGIGPGSPHTVLSLSSGRLDFIEL